MHFVRKDHEYNAGGKRTDECDCVMFSVFLLYSVHSVKNKESRPNATTRNCSDCSVINGSFLGLTQNNSLKNYSRHISLDSRHVTLDSRLFSLDSRHVTLDPRLSTITQTRKILHSDCRRMKNSYQFGCSPTIALLGKQCQRQLLDQVVISHT